MRKLFFLFLLLFCLTYNAFSKVTVVVENSPFEGLQSYLQEEVGRDSSAFNYGLSVFDSDTVRVSFVELKRTRFIEVDFYSSYLRFVGMPWYFCDLKLERIVEYIYMYSYRSNKNMSYYMEAVSFRHRLRGGKKILGSYDLSFYNQRPCLFVYAIRYLENYEEPEYKTVEAAGKTRRKGKVKKETVPVPRIWKDAFVESSDRDVNFVYVKDDQDFMNYFKGINKNYENLPQ